MRNIARRKGRRQTELRLPAPSPSPPSSPLGRLRSDMDRLFEGFFRDPWRAVVHPLARAGSWTPDIEIVDGGQEITVRAEIPGIDPKDLEVTVAADRVTIAGQKTEEKEERGQAFVRSERRFGVFRRSLSLPAEVDADRVSADYDKGVLTIRAPKSRQEGSKRVEVTARAKSP